MSELPDNNYEEARRWAAQAGEDLRAAKHLLGDEDLPARVACFLGHLVAEKALKAVLIDCGVPFRKIHDLPDLAAMLPDERRAAFDADALERLNPWVIDGRYADDHVEASHELAARLVALAGETLGAALEALDVAAGTSNPGAGQGEKAEGES